jgi:hypothetical protein
VKTLLNCMGKRDHGREGDGERNCFHRAAMKHIS